jgi:hypothetical protein|tara:strand:+ start:1684 stop:1899 length:216 start_codon:yes stop_codon:yes gene_type:complete
MADAVTACKRAGIVSATTRSSVGLQRNPERVRAELEMLARNEAAQLGANTIVAMGPPAGDAQTFEAYDCQR